MKPTELDESLLTAYLDDELSDAERRLVEEQLKVNDRWQQTLSELEGVRKLIRDLPKPALARSLVNGPWKHVPALPQAALECQAAAREATQNRFSLARMALAASILMGAFGTFAWLRFENERDEIALTENKKDVSNWNAAIESEASSMNAPAQSASTADIESDRLVAPLAAATSGARAELPQDKFRLQMAAPSAAAGTVLPEPVETFYAKVTNRQKINAMLDQVAASAGEQQNAIGLFIEPIPTADETRATYFLKSAESASTASPSIPLSESRRYEFRFQRSNWPAVAKAMSEMGIELVNLNASATSEALHELFDKKQETSKDVASVRPPTLTGPIEEPSDWIRVIVERSDAK